MVQNSININSIDLSEVRARVAKTLMDGLQLDMSTQDCAKLLRRQVNTKTNLVIMFVDINNSTEFQLIPGRSQIRFNGPSLCSRDKQYCIWI